MRLTIRPSTYRNVEGFTVSGRTSSTAFMTRIFTTTRSSAEHIRAKLKRGESIETVDFAPKEKA